MFDSHILRSVSKISQYVTRLCTPAIILYNPKWRSRAVFLKLWVATPRGRGTISRVSRDTFIFESTAGYLLKFIIKI